MPSENAAVETAPQAFPAALPMRVREMASVQPSTLNAEARTLDLIWTAGATVRRRDFWNDYTWDEELVVSPEAVNLERFAGGNGPLLDQHFSWGGTRALIGRILSAGIEGGQGVATVRITDADDAQPVWQRVADGTIRNVSVGYTIDEYELIRSQERGGVDRVRVTRWTPHEISFVTVPADPAAHVRAAGASAGGPTPAAFACRQINDTSNRAAAHNAGASTVPPESTAATTATTDTPAPDQAAIRAATEAAVTAERARVAAVTARCASVAAQIELPENFLNDHIARGSTSAQVGEAILDLLATRTAPVAGPAGTTARVERDNTDPVEMIAAMSEALAARATESRPAGQRVEMTERGRRYAYHGLLDLSADLARAHGSKIPAMARGAQLFDLLMAERSHTTSDFPILLADAGNKILQAAYKQATPTYRSVFARKTFRDFRPHHFISAGDFPVPLEVGETGEYKYGTMSESKQDLVIGTYGRIMRLTRRILVNDDLGAFSDMPTKVARRITDWENGMCWQVLGQNAGAGPSITETGRNLFNTTDKTLAASGTAIDVANVGAGRAAMQKLTSLDGLKLNLTPKFLVVSPDNLTAAEQFLAPIVVPTKDADINVFKGKLQIVSDANLTGNAWYLLADPADAEVLVYGHLAGAEAPRMYSREGFTTDGVDIKVSYDFMSGALNWRGAYKNPGL